MINLGKLGFGLLGAGTIHFIATLLIAGGVFFFPLGYSEAFFLILENLAGGQYWTAVKFMYIFSFILLIAGAVLMYFDNE